MTEVVIFTEVRIIIFLFGIIIGSFLNVCIFRLPRNEGIIFGRSHCLSCGNVLRWYELIPVVSYVIQRGRCRSCGERISLQYPLVELLNGVCWLWIFWVRGIGLDGLILSLAASVLIVVAVIDWKTYQIPFGCNIAIGILGILRLALEPSFWPVHVIGLFTVSVPFLIIYLVSSGQAIGGGDVKLMAAAGLLLGWRNILLALMLGSVAASVIHLTLMRLKGRDRVLAFGPYLAFGIMTAMLYGDKIIHWYLGTFIGVG